MEKGKVQADIIGNGYKKLPGGRPARTDNRRQKMDRIMRKEKYNFD